MPATEELLVFGFVTAPAVGGGDGLADLEAVMGFLFLLLGGLVAFQAGDAFRGMDAHLVFVDNGVMLLRVALGALARGLDEGCAGLPCLDRGPTSIDEKAREHQRETDDQSNEDRAKRHVGLPCGFDREVTL